MEPEGMRAPNPSPVGWDYVCKAPSGQASTQSGSCTPSSSDAHLSWTYPDNKRDPIRATDLSSSIQVGPRKCFMVIRKFFYGTFWSVLLKSDTELTVRSVTDLFLPGYRTRGTWHCLRINSSVRTSEQTPGMIWENMGFLISKSHLSRISRVNQHWILVRNASLIVLTLIPPLLDKQLGYFNNSIKLFSLLLFCSNNTVW